MTPPICSRCGASAGDDESFPPGWSFQTGRRGLEWVCISCTRANVRAIEAKLPEEWWE